MVNVWFLFFCFLLRRACFLLYGVLYGGKLLYGGNALHSDRSIFFPQGASAPCEKKIEKAEAVGRPPPVTTYHARDRNALPTARIFSLTFYTFYYCAPDLLPTPEIPMLFFRVETRVSRRIRNIKTLLPTYYQHPKSRCCIFLWRPELAGASGT